ncbi:MAG: valine--tRNA ligase [Candidatus Delongbacteria bacterium]
MARLELSRTWEPGEVEARLYRSWEDSGCFQTDPSGDQPAFVINMPPPNVTGQLHMGHGLQDSVQDAFIRYKRMQGFDALWQPGKDHAGIATQNVVEKLLAQEGTNRHKLGRAAFLSRAWEWKEKYGDIITEQKRKLGDSADWQHEVFTMDPGPSLAVREVFVRLFEKGLIYQGDYIVNWCPRCHTAISDEEVDHEEKASHLWHMAYPVLDEAGQPTAEQMVVATTRPETMLGDVAVAVHPEDARYRHLVGRKLRLPLVGRELLVIADEFVDPAFGTGCVKVTPAHDPNDFEMGKRHGLTPVKILDIEGRINQNGGSYAGLDRYEARQRIVEDLEAQGLLLKIEEHANAVGQCQRCSTVVEPYLSRQWFVRMKPLADAAVAAVQAGDVRFHPKRWENVFFHWMDGIRDWCISRQLWWGHRIPVFTCAACGHVMVNREDPATCAACASPQLSQDEDVLDTWFSSWLWPFTTLGWPDLDNPRFRKYYPTHLMVTGYDIIFFWVSRMIMAGIEFTGQAPFRDIYFTGIVKDAQGRKMSKSLGNGIDPLEMVQTFGADAVRYSMIALNTEGQDIKLSVQKFEMGRNFANKIWQAFRFLHMQDWSLLDGATQLAEPCCRELADEWILSRLHSTRLKVEEAFERYRINEAQTALYEFIWGDFCDWYVELAKPRLYNEQDPAGRKAALEHGLHVFLSAMQLLSPFMPFIAEEIWRIIRVELAGFGLTPPFGEHLMRHRLPAPRPEWILPEVESEFALVQGLTTALRNIRAEQNIKPRTAISAVLGGEPARLESLKPVLHYIQDLAQAGEILLGGERPRPAAANVVDGIDVWVPLAGLIDLDVERARLQKEMQRLEGVVKSLDGKLGNAEFIARAPADVVEKERAKLDGARQDLAKLQQNLAELG